MRIEHEEELEVLKSIYEGDPNFIVVNNNTFQYKFEDACGNKSFMVELQWDESYPEAPPTFNLELFYNKHLIDEVKHKINACLEEQAQNNLGMSMTFTLFEWIKEFKESLLENQPSEVPSLSHTVLSDNLQILDINEENDSKSKKEHLTKAQKRKIWDRQTVDGERARGWNWIDIVKHLSQTGNSSSTNE